jgi:hypothetical protein
MVDRGFQPAIFYEAVARNSAFGGPTRQNSVEDMVRQLAIDLFCGLGGWAEGFLAEGYRVVGFDIERHDYGTGGYPAQLVIQDVTTLHGSQFRDAAVIVASPPCQAYSYRAMPWKKAKALPPPDNTLFDSCFRIQREACEAAGRYIPLIVENVRGAQPWVGWAKWHFGSYYLWGDVPALMPITLAPRMKFNPDGTHHPPGSWFAIADSKTRGARSQKIAGQDWNRFKKNGEVSPHWRMEAIKQHGSGPIWFDEGIASFGSKSGKRRAAAAAIAKIPFPLAQHIARCFKEPAMSTVHVPGRDPVESISSDEL